ncbi:polysaccharide pyruvyl transferase family protein [Agrobacterium tumefaciens]|uniref:polysaccharide pyruvyl transferase family protein n=1 Tax=Agrobacterium tumefaciens TaxID=358 RepID=UPI0015744576|nr:polysaccharide pyruvyl transferase family protein [Agrobacterium tumefaciens]NTE56985.1 polysaccharide pyruvyl transferase family protein [Agrobacterium tumefaciens]NTE57026.1 polysaccharide pyruvyl transferase family protein [Agrobacterium tumefaciens]NTE69528.1 polysaccharide pyruvyl transferase family protein [Agrobacterium tumefaciens]NTE69569.1 polysaccharide pyruvyl transferase family protein [Agrobacterium tumefaciens]
MNTHKQNKILILGGYGGNNVGDDAQLAGSLNDLRTAIPEATLVVLTPDLVQTAARHNVGAVGYAPRVSFFDYDEDWKRYAHFGIPEHTEWLQTRAEDVFSAAQKYSKNEPHSLTSKQKTLVDEIRTARLVYYSGGGYMMGPTASRLWDAMLVCRLADLFGTPVVMSGQNIGVWVRDYDRDCARKGFSTVSIITTRDDTFSRDDLAKIGVVGDHIYPTHDDAFFIPTAPQKVSGYILKRVGIDPSKPFISLSLHLLEGGLELLREMRSKTDLPIAIVPTCPPDQKVQLEIYEKAQKEGVDRISIIRKLHSHSEVKGVVSMAHAVVSSRHHPLIFAMGHGVPCVSVNMSPYFNAKNFGAMDLCGVGEFCLDFEQRKFTGANIETFGSKFLTVLGERDHLSKTILDSHKRLNASKARFIEDVCQVYGGRA